MDSGRLTASALCFGYGNSPVLRGFDLDFEPGALHGIVGPNGCGKSTLLALLSGHLEPDSGSAALDGIPAREYPASLLARRCTLVEQEPAANFPFTVFETVLMGRHPHIPRFARPQKADLDITGAALAVMDLAPLRHRVLADLSGGERQRAMVARGLAQDTPALLLDEPTSSMDIRHALSTMTELKRLAGKKGRTVIAVLHDLNLAARFCDRVTMLSRGTVHASGTVEETLTPGQHRSRIPGPGRHTGHRSRTGHHLFTGNIVTRIPTALLLILLLPATSLALTLTDDGGREISFDKPFTRIISLYAAHSENLFDLGLDDAVIGVTRNEDYPAQAMQKPAFNARDGVERFLAAEPDLVLIRPMLDRGYPALWKRLEQHGVTVVSLQPNTIDEMFGYWRILGMLTGRDIRAEEMIREFRDKLDTFEQRLACIPEADRPKVFFESIHSRHATFSPGSMPLFVLHYAGGRNAAPDAKPRHGTNIAYYGLERLLAKGADIDVYLAQYGAMNTVSEKSIRNGPASSRIKAVLNNAVFLVDEHLVSRPTMRLLTGIDTVYRLLHW